MMFYYAQVRDKSSRWLTIGDEYDSPDEAAMALGSYRSAQMSIGDRVEDSDIRMVAYFTSIRDMELGGSDAMDRTVG